MAKYDPEILKLAEELNISPDEIELDMLDPSEDDFEDEDEDEYYDDSEDESQDEDEDD